MGYNRQPTIMPADAATLATPHIGPGDRLGLMLFFAAALHAIVILGITFIPSKHKNVPLPLTMEVILVHSKSDQKPDKPDYLAQVTQRGGGNVKEKRRPSSPFANTTSLSEKGDAMQTQPLMAPPPQQAQNPHQVITTDQRSSLHARVKPGQQRPETPQSTTAPNLIPPSEEVARLSAEISQRVETYAKMPRQKYITANTQEYVAASYEEAWRLKVERIGNLNYPDAAKRQNLSGNLLLDVAINPDGSLRKVSVMRSSGYRILDDAAVRIVKLAAPFAPLSPALRKETDVLHILRTWQFQSDNSLATR